MAVHGIIEKFRTDNGLSVAPVSILTLTPNYLGTLLGPWGIWRRWRYARLSFSSGREFRHEVLPPYDERRIKTVRKLAQKNRKVGFMVATGGAMSAWVRQ